MAKAKAPEAQSPELPDPEHELNPDVYHAPEPVEPAPQDEPAAEPTEEPDGTDQ